MNNGKPDDRERSIRSHLTAAEDGLEAAIGELTSNGDLPPDWVQEFTGDADKLRADLDILVTLLELSSAAPDV